MTAEQLRNSILQEAISGRLVPQDPNDEPASVLLQHIREEKERLVKEGKLKKKDLVEAPITEEEIPFEIPSSWVWVNLEYATYQVGNKTNQIQSKDIKKEGIYRVVSQGQKLYDGYSNNKECVINDLPLVMFGDHTRNVKYVDFPFVIGADGTKFFKAISIEARFLYYWMVYTAKTLRNRGYARHYTLLRVVPFPLPPLAEQKRIVAKLEELLPIVEQYGKAQKELDELNAALPTRLRQSILQEAISGKLVPQNENDEPVDILFNHIQEEKLKLIKQNIIRKKEAVINAVKEDEIPFDIPSSWKWCHLEELVAILDGYRKPVSKHDREVGTYPYYGANGVLDYVRDYIFDGEYLLVGEDGSVITSYGNPIVNKASGKIWVNNHAHVLQECGKLGYYDYLFYALQAISIKKYIHGFMPKYSQGDLRKTMIPLPPLAEQQRIVAKIEELFEQIDKITK